MEKAALNRLVLDPGIVLPGIHGPRMSRSTRRKLLRELFAHEIFYSRSTDATGKTKYSFNRGALTLARTAKLDSTIPELYVSKYQNRAEVLGRILDECGIDNIKTVLELGPAWGASTSYLKSRFSPERLEVYEIDKAWRDWLTETFQVTPRPCDGETFQATESSSIDLVLAVNILFFLPLVKQWSYMLEMARVLRPGGYAIFNVHLADGNASSLRKSLDLQFPKRSYGLLAPHCIASSFPDDKFEHLPRPAWIKSAYYIMRKRG